MLWRELAACAVRRGEDVLECRGVDHGDTSLSCGDHRHLGEPLPNKRNTSAVTFKERERTYDIVANTQTDLPEWSFKRVQRRSAREGLTFLECLFAGDINVEEMDFTVLDDQIAWRYTLSVGRLGKGMRGRARTLRVVHGTRVEYLIRRFFDLRYGTSDKPHAVCLCHAGEGGDAFRFRGVFREG